MERRPVDFYFDYTSPYSYLAFTRMPQLEAAGADFILHPVFLGGIIRTLGITPPFQQPGFARARYVMTDVARWARQYDVPLTISPYFPVNTLHALRATPFVEAQGRLREWATRCFDAIWAEGLDLGDENVVRAVAQSIDLDPEALWQAASSPENKLWVKQATDAAIERGVFGVPTFFVGGEQIWGNDRLHFVERALQGAL